MGQIFKGQDHGIVPAMISLVRVVAAATRGFSVRRGSA